MSSEQSQEQITTVSAAWLNQLRDELLTASRDRDTLREQLAALVTMGFNAVGSSGAKRKQHMDALTVRLHELQAALTAKPERF